MGDAITELNINVSPESDVSLKQGDTYISVRLDSSNRKSAAFPKQSELVPPPIK